jgi:hypothetical protein
METDKINFVASVDEEHLEQIGEIAKRMEENGFFINKIRRLTGTISGIADSLNAIHKINIKGVSIEPERSYQAQTRIY